MQFNLLSFHFCNALSSTGENKLSSSVPPYLEVKHPLLGTLYTYSCVNTKLEFYINISKNVCFF